MYMYRTIQAYVQLKGRVVYTSAQSRVIQKNIHDPILSHQEGNVVGGIGLEVIA